MEKRMQAMMAAVAMAAAGIGTGCAAIDAPEPNATPTHRWVAQMDVSSAKYNFDNKLCTEQSMVEFHAGQAGHGHAAQGDGPNTHAHASAPEFALYQRCMQGKGYDLATY